MDSTETTGRPLASNIQQPEASTQPPTPRRKRQHSSPSSDERVGGTKSTSSRRRPGIKKESLFAGPHTGTSRGDSLTMQPSASPTQMSPELSSVSYTRTGRISKAKKGRKVHNCECGRSYTRAEHLRRHQKNHAQEALVCDFPECGKTFYRIDLLQRHQERHNEIGKESDSRRPSLFSQGDAGESRPQVSVSVPLQSSVMTTPPQNTTFYQQPITSLPEQAANPSLVKQRPSYSAHQTSVPIQVQVDGLQTGIAWNDPFGQSYSPSSGYASPVPGDCANNMFANPPYVIPANRTRTSSNASFIQAWEFPSRSPTSATSTMAYTWTSNDKSPAPSNLYLATSYPMTSMPLSVSVDAMPYGHFGPKSLAQRDEEEQAYLFPEQSFGMGQQTYPYEQYLDNYWRLFHPTFPIIHRSTIDGINEPPMLLAAMIAVGGQYSNDASVKRKARILHDRCIKLLDKRILDVVVEPERLSDQQALFLIEILSQYRARRAAKTLSTRFDTLYQKLAENFRITASNIVEIVSTLAQPENATFERWNQWIELSGQQRLLLGCYILEYQQATLLARSPRAPVVPLSSFDLPLPAHSTLWDATTPSDWAIAAQQYAHLPSYVYEVDPERSVGPFDSFQSTVLIASRYNITPPALPPIDHLLDNSPVTKHQLLTAKLIQVTPIRALLAVSGESWILSEKVPSPQAFLGFKSVLKTWVNSLWMPSSDTQIQSAKESLKLAIEILQHALISSTHDLHLELGADMGLYFAVLVIWTVTVAANSRINSPQTQAQPQRFQTRSPSSHYPTTPTHFSTSTPQPSQSPNPAHPTSIGLVSQPHTSSALPSTSTSMLHSEITMTAMDFLTNALVELELLGTVAQWPRDVVQWQQGCAALLRWVKMRLRSGTLKPRDSVIGPTSAGTGLGSDGLGELLDGVIGVIEKILNRGTEKDKDSPNSNLEPRASSRKRKRERGIHIQSRSNNFHQS